MKETLRDTESQGFDPPGNSPFGVSSSSDNHRRRLGWGPGAMLGHMTDYICRENLPETQKHAG